MELLRPVVVVVAIVAGVLLFTPNEAFFEGTIALAIVVAAVVGFSMPSTQGGVLRAQCRAEN